MTHRDPHRVVACTAWLVLSSCAPGTSAEPPPMADPLCDESKCDLFGDSGGQTAIEIETWAYDHPINHGFDYDALVAADAYAEGEGAECLLVARDGMLVHERYFRGTEADTLHDSWSIAKTFTSALVGIAVARGEIASIDDPAWYYVPEWETVYDERSVITVRDLLSGTAGFRYGDFLGTGVDVGDFSWLYLTRDLTTTALDNVVEAEPGTRWRYHNHAVQVLERVLEWSTGVDPEQYAETHLWGPIGMTVAPPGEDRRGYTHWRRDPAGNITPFTSVHATCRGLLKFGQLLLQRGSWDGEQIIDEAYFDEMTWPSSELNRAYGLLTWLNHGGPAIGNTHNVFAAEPFPEAPADLISAQGVGQNFIDVVPSTGTVYVHVRSPSFLAVSEMINDGKQELHREVLRRLLAAN